MTLLLDPDLDLRIDRVIRVPRQRVWEAWTDPTQLAQWFLPEPLRLRVERLEVAPAGAFITSMSEDGVDFVPHIDACFLVVEPGQRIVWTNALDSTWRPASPMPVALTAEITFADHPDGCAYSAVARHGDAAARTHHEELGFVDGWGAVTDQLARLVGG